MIRPFIDIHSHERAAAPNCVRVFNLIVGTDTFEPSVCTAGIHPWHIAMDKTAQWEELVRLSKMEEVIGIGECGLDKICRTSWKLQVEVFEKQVEWAKKVKKPLIIHCVRAYQEVLKILAQKKVDVPVIFHGFNKKKELGERILKEDYYLSLGAYVLQGKHDELIKCIPLERLFLETDNNTTDIVAIFSYFCAARKIEVEDLKRQLILNLERVFKYGV